MASKKNSAKLLKLLLVVMLAATGPLQAVGTTVSAASTTSSSSSSSVKSSRESSSSHASSNSSSSSDNISSSNDFSSSSTKNKDASSSSSSSSAKSSSTTSKATSRRKLAATRAATSDTSVDSLIPDENLRQLIFNLFTSDSYYSYIATDQHGSHEITSIDQITEGMISDLNNIIIAKGENADLAAKNVALAAKVTDLTGLQYAPNLVQVKFDGATIKKAPGDWSVFANLNNASFLGTVDATSKDADLKDLAKLKPYEAGGPQYDLTNNIDMGMPNLSSNGGSGIQVTKLTAGDNMTYDSDSSAMRAYIPLSNWYKGFMTTSGSYEYGDSVATYPDLPNGDGAMPQDGSFKDGLTLDMKNHRIIVDLNVWGGKELKLPSFAISDHIDNSQLKDGKAGYYSTGNTLDAEVPNLSVQDNAQTVEVTDLKNPTGAINTSTFGFSDTDTANLTIKSGDLTSDDISFSPDLTENKINFTLTASGLKKLIAGDLKSNITISAGDKIIDLTLTLTEPASTWMPDAALRTDIEADLTTEGLGSLTKTNLAKLTKAQNVTGVSNLTGLEYATSLTSLSISNSSLNDLKTTNSQILPKMRALSEVEIDNSDLGGSLADWGLKDITNLTSLTAKSDSLTNPAITEYADDAKLTKLDLSGNQLTGELSQFPVANWVNLGQLSLKGNQLTGEIPATWSGLANLEILDLSSNQLSGTLDNIGQLAKLKQVYLESNAFEGSLPAAWLTAALTYLDVSSNKLSGEVPSLSAATNLATLSVENNQLTGALPDLTNAKQLTNFRYGSNHITSGSAADGANGNYQTWSITDPDWQTSSNNQKMTLDLSKYYGGEQGQTGYQYLSYSMPGDQSGVTLDKTDSAHPLLTIDTTSTTVQNGNLTVNLYDQAKKQSSATDSNYLATITIPVTLAIPKTYEIDTNDVDFGSHPVGTGLVNAAANAFKLSVHSTNATGDSYQLTAQTTGMVASGHTVPLYYYHGQHNILLTDTAQAIYDYQPTSADDTTVVGDSSDTTKGNLRTDIGVAAYTGNYQGQVTYTLASSPADATPAAASDMSQVTTDTLGKLSPTIAAGNLDVTQEATRTKLQTNMTSFVQNQLADSDGVLYSSYEAAHAATDTTDGTREELTETNGMWLLALAMSGDETTFDNAFSGVTKRFYDSDTQTFNWQSLGTDHKITSGSASVDDLRIIQALMIMNQKSPNNDRTTWLNKLIDGFTKHDLNAYYQMIDGYSKANGQEKKIRLDYLDLATLKAVYEAKGLGTAGETAYNQQLKLIKDSYISDQLPFFATYYDYSTGNYQVNGDGETGEINVTDGLLTMLNLAKVGELPQTSLDWLKAHTANRTIYNEYNIADGTPVAKNDAASNYGYVAQIAAALGDTSLYNQALTVMKSMTSDDDNSGDSHLTSDDPLYGSTQYGGQSFAFNDLNMLLAYNSVFATN